MKKKDLFNNSVIKVLNGMAMGLMASLVIGVLLKQFGTYLNIKELVLFGQIAQYMLGAAIGAGVAISLDTPPLGVYSTIVCGLIGSGAIKFVDGSYKLYTGEAVGALAASIAGAVVAKLVFGRTKCDIIIVPGAAIIAGGFTGIFVSPYMTSFMLFMGNLINRVTELKPLLMGVLIALIMGIIITSPISSAAISISLGLSGLAAGAATVGCACHMVGFAIMGFKENGINGLISHGLGTSKLQMANSLKNPFILVPPMISSCILGALSTTVFKMLNNKIGAGMGTSGLIGQISTIEVMGKNALGAIILMHFIFPAVIAFFISKFMRNRGFIKPGDLKI